jgi:leucyl aminopeptidase
MGTGMKLGFAEIDLGKKGAIVIGLPEGAQLAGNAAALDKATGGALARAIDASKFKAKSGDLLDIVAPHGIAATRIVLLGLGKTKEYGPGKAADLGGGLAAFLLKLPEAQTQLVLDPIESKGFSTADLAAHIAYGATLRAYRFDRYRTKEKADDKPAMGKLTLALADHSAAKKLFGPLEKVAEAIEFARDLVAEPPNVIYPESYAERVKDLKIKGLDVEILNERDLKKLGMGALIGVGQGSVHGPRVVVLKYHGAKSGQAPIAFVGKGVTFDSGGLSLKTAKGMEDMKWDMAGSAAVVGTLMALAGRGAKVNAVGVIGLVENMPSGSAQRPGDVVTSLSGQTIEVLNTDAEGRLVLADALWYTVDQFKPAAMINLATLTGAIITALGHEHAGLFSNNDDLSNELLAAGKATGETLWRLPLGEAYDKLIKSDIADMKNIGDGTAGSITAAQFLQRFVGSTPWAHLDIAGTAWAGKDKPTIPKGATGWGVRLLNQLVADRYEAK